jgi:hypothetical protein
VHLDDSLGSIFSSLTNREIPPEPGNQFGVTVIVREWVVPCSFWMVTDRHQDPASLIWTSTAKKAAMTMPY